MPISDYLVGLAYFGGTLAAAGLATTLVARRQLGHLTGAPWLAGVALTAVALLLLAHLAPGLIGILQRETVLAASLLIAAAVWRFVPALLGRGEPEDAPLADGSGRLSWALALLALGAVAVYLVALAGNQAFVAASSIDATAFHLPNVAVWLQSGTFWPVEQFIPYQGQAYYPQNGNVLYLAAALPWDNDFLVRSVNYPFLALAAVSMYAIGRELGAPRAPALLFSVALLPVPWVAAPAVAWVMPDAIMLGTFGAGVLFLLRYARTGRRSELVLAGIGLGVALGTKWYGVAATAVVVAVWAVGTWLASRQTSAVTRPALVLGGLIAAAGGVWMVRNLVAAGSPVYPGKVEALGVTIFDAPRDPYREAYGSSIADYLGDLDVLETYVWPALRDSLAYVLPLLVAGAAVAALLAIASRRRPGTGWRGAVLGCAACVALIAASYVMTPYSAFGLEGTPTLTVTATRYLVPALVIAAPLTAWAVGRLGRAGLALEFAGLLVVADAVRRSATGTESIQLGADGVAAAVAVVLLAGGAALVAGRGGLSVLAGLEVRGFAAVALLGTAGLATAGYFAQTRFNDRRYHDEPVLAWISRNAPDGHRVGLAGRWEPGVFPTLASFGPRFDNHVAYVGRVSEGQLRRYPDRAGFLRALRGEGYDLVVVGRGQPARPMVKEQGWVASAGFEEVALSRRFALYRRVQPGKGQL